MKTDYKPGPWGYYCRQCGKLALAFSGPLRPTSHDLLEDMDICQRGPYPSRRRTKINCHHCQTEVATRHGKLIEKKILLIDRFIETYDKQEAKRLFKMGRGTYRNRPTINREFMGVHFLDDEEPDEPIQEAPEEEEGEAALAEAERAGSAKARFEANHPADETGESVARARAAVKGGGETDKKAPSRPKPKVKKATPDSPPTDGELDSALG